MNNLTLFYQQTFTSKDCINAFLMSGKNHSYIATTRVLDSSFFFFFEISEAILFSICNLSLWKIGVILGTLTLLKNPSGDWAGFGK